MGGRIRGGLAETAVAVLLAVATMAISLPIAPLGAAAVRSSRTPAGWRVDWAVPGGGVQSTLVLDHPGEAP